MPFDIDVLANDFDGNDDPLTITNVTDPPNGTTAVNDNGTPGDPTDDTVTYTPDAAFSGLDFFDYTIDDGFGGSDTASVTVNVGNNPPVAVDDAVNTPTDTPVNIFVLANDSDLDSDPLEIGAVTNPPNGTAVIDDNGTPGDTTDDFVTYTPDAGFTGVDTFDYILEDGNLGSDAGTVTVTVDNAPPVAVDDNLSTPTDTPLNADVLSNDTDANSDPLEITSVTTPTDGNAVIDDNGTPGDTTDDFILYTPNTAYRGPDSFDYTIEDGRGGSDTATVNITVENADPVAVDDPVSTQNATPVDVFVLANDSDANGDPLAITGVTSPSDGIVAIDDNGTPGDTTDDFVTYTPNAVFVGIDTFDYTVEDGVGGSDTGTVTVTVENALPVATDDVAMTPGGAFVDIDVLANDTDANNDTLTIQSILQPANGTAVINDNGTPGNPSDDLIRYTPNPSFRGADPFQYTVADGRGGTDQGLVTVTVQNQPPVAVDDEAFTPRNVNVDVFVLANDVDANGDPISLESVTQPVSGAAVSINDNGTPGDATDDYVVVNPDGPFEGTTSFTYTINDGAGGQDTGTVLVNVDNAPPVATDDAFNAPRNSSAPLTVLANDSDADLDPLEIISFTDPPNGSVVLNDNGTPAPTTGDDFLDYTPDPGFEGVDIFMYTISDGRGAEDSATVTVTVVNTPPTAVDDSAQTPTNVQINIDVTANDSDLNGDPITLNSVGTPSNGNAVIDDLGTPLNPFDDEVTYTPNTSFKGQDVFSYGIVDDVGAVGVANVTVTVLNALPIAVNDSALTAADTPVNIDVLANDTDANNDPLGIESVTDPPNGTAVIDDNGTPGDTTDDFVTYTPDPAFSGVDTFDYTVQDDEEPGSTATVTVTVNNPPVAVDDALLIQLDVQTDILVLANDSDPDSDPLEIVSVDDPFNGTAVINDNGTPGDTTDDFIRYTPDPGFFGVDAFDFTIDDGFFTDSATITVTVNAPPNAVDNLANTTTEVPVNIFVLDNDSDPNGDPLEITLVDDPPNGVAVIDDNGTPGVTTDDFIVYTSDALFDGIDVFTYTIEDGQGGSDTATVTVTVTGVNPVAVDDSVSDAPRDTPVDIFVLANDSDPNSDPLQIDSVTVPSNGSAVIDDNGTPGDTTDDYVTYTPNTGFGGVDTFDYTLGDGQGNTDVGTVTVTMINTAPIASDDSDMTTPDTQIDIFVLANDSDPEGDPLQITVVDDPPNGTAVIDDNGTPGDTTDDFLDYTPDPAFEGVDVFTYTISDGWGASDGATVTVTVAPVEPVAVDDSVTDAPRDTPVDIFVLANDSDPNSDPLQIDSVTVPSNGSAVIDDNGTPGDTTDDYVTYTPNAGFGGVDTFDYTLGDGQGNTDVATVTVTMINTAPIANGDFAVTTQDTSVDIFVLTNDSDPDGDSFSIDSVTNVPNGSVVIDDNGTPADPSDDYLVYTPDPGYTGGDAFVYRIIDEWGLIDPASVNVTINP